MKKRYIRVMACSDSGARFQLTLSAETDDLRGLIVEAITKISQYSSSSEEKLRIEYIDSVSHLHDVDE